MMYRGPGQGDQQAAGGDADRIYLTPAQVALQTQLKSKHAELHRRIALQQAELLRLGEQLALTYRDLGSFFNHPPPQQQQQHQTSPSQPPNLIQPQSMLIRSHQQLPQQQQINLTLQQQQQQQQQQITGMDVGFSGDVIQHQYLPSNS